MPFVIRSPDGFSLHVDDPEYATREEANEALLAWAKSFEWQGFYKTGGGDYLPVGEIPLYSRILEVEEMQIVAKVLRVPDAKHYDAWCEFGLSGSKEGKVVADFDVEFDDGYVVSIQVVSGRCGEPCWTQGVLFDGDGCEIASTLVRDTFTGEYTIEDSHESRRYVVRVEEEKVSQDTGSWKTIADSAVNCHWKCWNCGETCEVPPDWYCNNGTPTCEKCNVDMFYRFTQIKDGAIHALQTVSANNAQ